MDDMENNPAPEGAELSTPAEEVEQEAPETEAEPDQEVEASEGDDETDAEEYEDIEWDDGKKYAVPKALKDGFMRQADYTRKTQEVAEARKAFEADRPKFGETVQLQSHGLEKMADLRQIDAQIKAYENVDWDRLQEDDPHEYLRHDRIYRGLSQKKQETTAEYQRAIGEVQQRQRVEHARAVQENQRKVATIVPGWSNETAQQIRSYGIEQGLSESELNTVYKAEHVAILNKARMFDELQKSRAKPKSPAPAQPVTRIKAKAQKATVNPDKLSPEDWVKWREKQLANR